MMAMPEADPRATPRRVLVVDDSELLRTLIHEMLAERGFEVLSASDGAEGAVVALREHPDVVVTDLEMPVMDGYQLARLLKSDSATSDIPLLILTSHAEASSRFWGLETGADGYLVKDELKAGLVPAVEELLEQTRDRMHRPGNPPQTPLEVLARVSRHLDSRLLEAVLVNRILERGMQSDGIREASDAVFRTVADFVDTRLIGLVLSEPEGVTILVRQLVPVAESSQAAMIDDVLGQLGVGPELSRELVVQREVGEGQPEQPLENLELFSLPLRGAQGVLVVAPRRPLAEDSRDRGLLAELTGHLALVLDNARLAQRLRELSMIDGLTRLLNRRTIHHRLCEELERARRYRLPFSVVLCDIDHFKKVNDTWGHLAGDSVLTAVAEIFRQQARTADVVGRFGGEEFLLLLPNTDLDKAAIAARRLLAAISSEPLDLGGGVVLRVTASLGAASVAELADPTPDALLALADERLYQAKAAGRNRAMP
jgi:two-component system, cell cycle response regulator